MFEHVIWVDEYIIQINHNTNIQKIRENFVHKLLKDYRIIDKTKGYIGDEWEWIVILFGNTVKTVENNIEA